MGEKPLNDTPHITYKIKTEYIVIWNWTVLCDVCGSNKVKSVKLHVPFAFHTRIRNGKEKNTQFLCCSMHHFTICTITQYTLHTYINKSYIMDSGMLHTSYSTRNSTSQLILYSYIFLSQIFLTCTCSSLYRSKIISNFQSEKILACRTYCFMHLNICFCVYYKVHIHPFLALFFF